MGIFSKKSSSESNVSNVTNVTNVGASEGSIAAADGSVVNVLDAGAVGRAFDLGDTALRGFGDLANRGIDEAFGFARESLGLVERSAGAAQKSFEGALESTLANLDEEQSGGAQRVLLLAALAIAAVVFLRH